MRNKVELIIYIVIKRFIMEKYVTYKEKDIKEQLQIIVNTIERINKYNLSKTELSEERKRIRMAIDSFNVL